ncbi:hypothetical protein PSP6_370025 [Paraburkholderia tropica]|nr:hypothetical protein PSP6_370025 [Paraburkholderia tropica]
MMSKQLILIKIISANSSPAPNQSQKKEMRTGIWKGAPIHTKTNPRRPRLSPATPC